jgi:hypothetical protein
MGNHKQETRKNAPMQIDADLHTQIKVSASAEKMSIKDFIGQLYGLYINQSAHQ